MPGNKGVDSENVFTPLACQTEPRKQKVPQVSVGVEYCENVFTPSTSQSVVPGKQKVPEVSVEALPVTRKPWITTAQENSTENGMFLCRHVYLNLMCILFFESL